MTGPAAPLQPRTAAGVAGLSAILAGPAQAVIATDFDGTLAAIVDRPEDARPAPGAVDALVALASLVGSIVIITGRPAATAVALGGLDEVAGLDRLVVLGQYGGERWDAATGEISPALPPAGLEPARRALAELIVEPSVPAGVEVEDKGVALTVHVRRTPDPAAALAILRPMLDALAQRTGLKVEPGRMVLELRGPGVDKGAALLQFAAERNARSVFFAGDDLGDLAAFDAVDRLREAGVPGLTVCSGSAEVPELVRRADLVADGPAGTVALFAALATMIQKD